MMESMKASLSKYIVKRRLEGGEFLYVYRPRGQSVAGKKAVWSILKSDDKTLNKLREATGLSDEEEFENIALKTLPLLPYEDAVNRTETKTTDMETNEETKVKEEVEAKQGLPLNTLRKTPGTHHHATPTYPHLEHASAIGNLESQVSCVWNHRHVLGKSSLLQSHKIKVEGLTSSAQKKMTSCCTNYCTKIALKIHN